MVPAPHALLAFVAAAGAGDVPVASAVLDGWLAAVKGDTGTVVQHAEER